jgi:DNA-binding FadR family transcriptional regulator
MGRRRNRPNDVVLTDVARAILLERCRQLGDRELARQTGVSRPTIHRALAGLPVRRQSADLLKAVTS